MRDILARARVGSTYFPSLIIFIYISSRNMVEAGRGRCCGSITAEQITSGDSSHAIGYEALNARAVDKDADHLESEMTPKTCNIQDKGHRECGPSRDASDESSEDTCAGRACCAGSAVAKAEGLITQKSSSGGCCSEVDARVEETPASGCCDGCEGSEDEGELEDTCCSNDRIATTCNLDDEAVYACGSAKAIDCCPSTTTKAACSTEAQSCYKTTDPLMAIEAHVPNGCSPSRIKTCSPASKSACEPPAPKAKGCCSKRSDLPLNTAQERSPAAKDLCRSSVTKSCPASNPKSSTPGIVSSECYTKGPAAPSNHTKEENEDRGDDCCKPSSAACCPSPVSFDGSMKPEAKGCCSSKAGTEEESSNLAVDDCCSTGIRQRRTTSKVTPLNTASGKKDRPVRRGEFS